MEKILVAFFSHSGNTEVVAKNIKENLGADLLAIRTVILKFTTHMCRIPDLNVFPRRTPFHYIKAMLRQAKLGSMTEKPLNAANRR